MKNDIPCIGQKKPTCTFCGGPYAEAVHPKMGKVMAPACNCSRPIHLGDLKLFAVGMEHDDPAVRDFVKEFIDVLEIRAKSERGH